MKRSHARGFTLIELVIAMAIVAILAAVALPAYNQHILRTHRAHARATLLAAAQWMERAATARGMYAEPPAGVLAVEGGRYQIAAELPDGVSYTLTATPIGAQAADRCGVYALTHTGLRTQRASAAVANPDTVAACWDR